MAAITKIVVTHHPLESAASVGDEFGLDASDDRGAALALAKLFTDLASGVRMGRVELGVETATVGNKATATVTVADASLVDDTDDLTIGSVTFKWMASPSGESQIDIGGSDAQSATNLAAAINAHSQLAGVVTATAAAAVVTITADYPGIAGELIALAETGNGQTLSAAALGGVTSTVTKDTRSFNFGIA